MESLFETLDVGFVALDYQGDLIAEPALTSDLESAVRLNAFPSSVPLNYRSGPAFSGLKVFAAREQVCVSRFFDGGATDAWRRPVLSARVAVLGRKAWRLCGGDVQCIGRFLGNNEIGQTPLKTIRGSLGQELGEGGAVHGRKGFVALMDASAKSVDFAARMVLVCGLAEDVVLYVPPHLSKESMLALILLLLPMAAIKTRQFSTACNDVEAMNREGVVFVDGECPSPSRTERLSRFLRQGKASANSRCTIDVASLTAPIVRAHRAWDLDVIALFLRELLEGNDWPPLSFHEKYVLLKEYMEDIFVGRIPDLRSQCQAAGLPETALTFAMRFDDRVKDIRRGAFPGGTNDM